MSWVEVDEAGWRWVHGLVINSVYAIKSTIAESYILFLRTKLGDEWLG